MGFTSVPSKTRISTPVRRNATAIPTTHVDVARQNSDAGAQAASQANNSPISGAVLILNQRFVVGTNTYVQHGLGRIPNGYDLVNKRRDPTQATPTAALDAERNTDQDPTNNQTLFLSLGPFQPFLADVLVW